MFRFDCFISCIHKKEAACTVSIFCLTGLKTGLSEKRSLLVAGNARNGNLAPEDIGIAVNFGTVADAGHHGCRNAEQLHHILVPLQIMDVVEHGAGGIGHIGYMDGAAGEIPHQPAVDCTESKLALLSTLAGTRNIVKYPLYFAS